MPKWEPIEVRFWRKVDRRGPDECWDWTASCNPETGYGAIGLDGKIAKAHRVSFFLEHGHWPEPMCCHSCDNRKCVNPAHLFEGDAMANHRDMTRKSRGSSPPHSYGEDHHNSKLTTAHVLAIRASYSGQRGEVSRLAECFCVGRYAVQCVIDRKTWANV